MNGNLNLITLLDRFQAIAGNPGAQFRRYLDDGKKVVLTAPEYTPDEAIHAMGLVPMGAWGADMPLVEAKRFFPAFLCSVVQSAVELGMRGFYDGASAIVIPSLCDTLKVMGENWKYAVPGIPFVPMVYPQNRKIPAAADFTIASFRRVADDLSRITGRTLSDAALHASIEAYNERNALMRKLEALLAERPEVTPKQRSAVFKSAFFVTVEEHGALVRELLDALENSAKQGVDGKRTRIVVSGILADSPSLLDALTENGFHVVADDVAAESRRYRTDAPDGGDALARLAGKHQAMGDCSVLYDPEKRRIGRLIETAKARGAKGVLVVLTKFCDPEEFDAPLIQKAAEAAGLAYTLVEADRQMTEYGQARTAIEALREMTE